MNNDKDKMHPEDMRNLLIFALASMVIYFLYNTFILEPQTKALKNAKAAHAELVLKDPQLLNVVTISREEAIAAVPRITFKNKAVSGSISLKGGQIDDLSLLEYFQTLEKKKNVIIFSPRQVAGARYTDYGWVSDDASVKLPDANTMWSVDESNKQLGNEAPVTLFWENGQGLRFERHIALDDEFLFTVTQKVINTSGKAVNLHPYALISQRSIPKDYLNMWIEHEGPMGFIGGELIQMDYAAMAAEPNKRAEAAKGWIGVSDKYWLTALIPTQDQMATYRFRYAPDVLKKENTRYQTDFTGSLITIANGASAEHSYNLYAGAKRVMTLEDYQYKMGVMNLDYAVDFGWFWFFTKPFFFALHFLGLLFGNMGVAILVLTFIVRMAVFPLTNISYKSFAKMKVVGPQITALRDEFSDDKERLQQEIVKLYQKEGVNPMSGCLPMLLQIPLFFAFYKTILITIEIRHAPFFGWIQDLSAKDPTTIFNLFGLLPYDPPSFLMIGVWPCVMLIAMLMQKKLNPPPQDKMQRDMMNMFPFFITFIMAGFASGLVMYWAFSAILSIMQQAYIMRSMGVPIYFFNKDHFKEELEQKVEMGPDVNPLMEMAEDEAEKALFGEGDDAPKAITPPKPKKNTKSKAKKKK